MPATAIDSTVFRNIFSTEAMRRVFSDENRVQKYLDFEAARARVEAWLGIIPQEAAADWLLFVCRMIPSPPISGPSAIVGFIFSREKHK